MTSRESVHLISSVLWAIFGLTVGSLAIVFNEFNYPVMVAMLAAIAGNSAHLISMSISKTGISVSSEKTP